MKNYKIITILFIIISIMLCLSIVSANENTTDTTPTIETQNTQNTITINDQQKIDKIIKSNKTETKKASKTPTNFDIIIRNNVVDNTTIDIGVIDYSTKKTIPNSALNIELPNKENINTKTSINGRTNITMKLAYGKNMLKITYPGTDKYYEYDYNLEVNVNKRNPTMLVNIDGSNTTGKVNITTKLRDTLTGKAISNEKTQISISDGRTISKNTDANGKVVYSLELENGKNIINITYPGSNKYNPAKTNTTITINKPKTNVNFDLVFQNLYVENTTIMLTLKDSTTKKIIPNTPVQIKIQNSKTYNLKTDKNGIITQKINAPVGKNYMTITYNGNNNYNKHIEKINFTVKKRESNLNLTVQKQDQNYKLKIKLTDVIFNKNLAKQTVTLNLPDSTNKTLKTDNNGEAYYTFIPKTGSQVYYASYPGTLNITNSSYKLTVTTPKEKIPVTFNVTVKNNIYKDDNITFTLINTKTNKVITNAPVTITLPKKTVKQYTNDKGQIVMKTNMTPGNNKVKLYYAGNYQYQGKNATADIKIVKRPSKLEASIKVTDLLEINVHLTDRLTNKSLANQKVEFNHPKQKVTLTTDENGKILEYIALPAGKAQISLTYSGNTYYEKSNTLTSNITIAKSNKTTTKITINKVTGTIGDKVKITANVKDAKNNKVTGGNIVFKLNGKTLKVDNTTSSNKEALKVSVKNGIAQITLTADKTLRNTKNIIATYSGSNNYYKNTSASIKPEIQLRKAQITVTTTPTIQEHYKIITFKVTVKDEANKANVKNDDESFVFFKINDKTLKDSKSNMIKVKVVNGIATYNYTIPQATAGINTNKTQRNYKLTATYYNPNYQAVRNVTSYNVKRSTTSFKITKTKYNTKTNTLIIQANHVDYKNKNTIGITQLNLKINGKTFKINNQTIYKVNDGKININIKLPDSIKKIKNITLTTGARLAYLSSKLTIDNITKI